MAHNIRNPKFNRVGTIDVEYEHPIYGWIPFSADPSDVEEHSKQIYDLALEMNPEPYVPEPVSIEEFRFAIDQYVNSKAKDWGYNSAEAIASYTSSSIPQWSAEAHAFVIWRDAVWSKTLSDLEKIQSGLMAPPATVQEYLSALPELVRPN